MGAIRDERHAAWERSGTTQNERHAAWERSRGLEGPKGPPKLDPQKIAETIILKRFGAFWGAPFGHPSRTHVKKQHAKWTPKSSKVICANHSFFLWIFNILCFEVPFEDALGTPIFPKNIKNTLVLQHF